jgi:hypothetical protein
MESIGARFKGGELGLLPATYELGSPEHSTEKSNIIWMLSEDISVLVGISREEQRLIFREDGNKITRI